MDLRNLKTTTGMDALSCQTPQINEKQNFSAFGVQLFNPFEFAGG